MEQSFATIKEKLRQAQEATVTDPRFHWMRKKDGTIRKFRGAIELVESAILRQERATKRKVLAKVGSAIDRPVHGF